MWKEIIATLALAWVRWSVEDLLIDGRRAPRQFNQHGTYKTLADCQEAQRLQMSLADMKTEEKAAIGNDKRSIPGGVMVGSRDGRLAWAMTFDCVKK